MEKGANQGNSRAAFGNLFAVDKVLTCINVAGNTRRKKFVTVCYLGSSACLVKGAAACAIRICMLESCAFRRNVEWRMTESIMPIVPRSTNHARRVSGNPSAYAS